MNSFQKAMLKMSNDMKLELTRIFHPEYKGVSKKGNTVIPEFGVKYTWVTIYANNKISCGITFYHGLQGPNQPMEAFEKAYRESSFIAWRFVDDPNYKIDDDLSSKVNEWLMNKQIPKPTPEEMFKNYYKD